MWLSKFNMNHFNYFWMITGTHYESESFLMLLTRHVFQASHLLSSVCVCPLSCFRHAQLFETIWTIARQAPLSMGFSRHECWSGLLSPPPENLPNPVMEPTSLALLMDSLPTEPPGKPMCVCMCACVCYTHLILFQYFSHTTQLVGSWFLD